MAKHVKTQRTPGAHEHDTQRRAVNNRYVVTFSQSDYDALREFVAGTKAVRTEDVRAILRRRMHYD